MDVRWYQSGIDPQIQCWNNNIVMFHVKLNTESVQKQVQVDPKRLTKRP